VSDPHKKSDPQKSKPNKSGLLIFAFLILISPLAVTEGEAYAEYHDADGWNQHDQDRAVQGALTFFRSASRDGVAHGAALREGGSGPSSKHQSKRQQENAKPNFA
jgi:hypothetical protein